MQANWDNHIKGEIFYYSLKKSGNNSYQKLSHGEIDVLSDKYKGQIEFTKQGDHYVWISNDNQKLTKTIESEEIISSGQPTGKYKKTFVYKNSDGSESITIPTNLYQLYGCDFRFRFYGGNVFARAKINNRDELSYGANTNVYETPYQYLFCRFHPEPRP